jgi:hypothetical protein
VIGYRKRYREGLKFSTHPDFLFLAHELVINARNGSLEPPPLPHLDLDGKYIGLEASRLQPLVSYVS